MEHLKRFFLPLFLAAMVALSWLGPLDTISTEQVDAGLKRALVRFATARTLNAIISVAQGTDVAVEPMGIGFKLAPGQILDPLNDLVEKFADLMLMASISFGIQRVLISVGGHWLISAALSAGVLFWSFLYIRRHPIPTWLTKILVISIVLRFAIPFVTVGSDALFQQFLAADYAVSQKIIETGATEAKQLDLPANMTPATQTVLEKMKGWIPDLNVSARFHNFIQSAEKWVAQIIKLMAIFLLQTLIFPVIFLWVLLVGAKSILRIQSPTLPPALKLSQSESMPKIH